MQDNRKPTQRDRDEKAGNRDVERDERAKPRRDEQEDAITVEPTNETKPVVERGGNPV